MNSESVTNIRSHKWLDSIAIGMSMLCAIHCLITPVLIVFLPILATTFWVHENFHLWMLFFVIPTTTAAVFMGCRQHKDRLIPILSAFGLLFLVAVVVFETANHSDTLASATTLNAGPGIITSGADTVACPHCAAKKNGQILTGSTYVNVLGGLLLAGAHVRNFLLCRKASCSHDPEKGSC